MTHRKMGLSVSDPFRKDNNQAAAVGATECFRSITEVLFARSRNDADAVGFRIANARDFPSTWMNRAESPFGNKRVLSGLPVIQEQSGRSPKLVLRLLRRRCEERYSRGSQTCASATR